MLASLWSLVFGCCIPIDHVSLSLVSSQLMENTTNQDYACNEREWDAKDSRKDKIAKSIEFRIQQSGDPNFEFR